MQQQDFRYKPCMYEDMLNCHKEELLKCEKLIDKLLSKFDNYDGVDFYDVWAKGIQVRLHNKQIEKYIYSKPITIQYDFSNIGDVPYQVVKEFVESDSDDRINIQEEFIEFKKNMIGISKEEEIRILKKQIKSFSKAQKSINREIKSYDIYSCIINAFIERLKQIENKS